jgi:hypothetical protein
MRKIVAVAGLIALTACHFYKVPREQFLLRIDSPWETPMAMAGKRVRTALATIVYFRDDHEYFELHFHVIEQNEETLYISENLPHASALGRWTKSGATVDATREKVSRGDVVGLLCKPVRFQISGSSVIGNAGGTSDGMYSAVSRLVVPDIQSYLKEIHQSRFFCPGVKPPPQ